MAKIDITKTELVWPGKYNEDGTLKDVPRVNLPFRLSRPSTKAVLLGDREEGRRNPFRHLPRQRRGHLRGRMENKLIWGDNLLVMGSLLEKFAGKIDLIYIDPPLPRGGFSFVTEIGERGLEIEKEQSLLEEKAYRDTWGRGDASFLTMMSQRIILMRDLLSNNGSFFLHCDWHIGHYLKVICDEIFGRDRLVNRDYLVLHRPRFAGYASI